MTLTTPKQLVAAFKKHGSLKAAGRETDTSWYVIHRLYTHALTEGLMERVRPGTRDKTEIAETIKAGKRTVKPKVGGRKRALRAVPLERHPEKVTRFLFTCAQNNTRIHEPFWDNLLILKEHYNAELHISRFAYIRNGLGARGDKQNYFDNTNASGSRKGGPDPIWFDERIGPYVSDSRREVAPGLVWCGESNIIPTAARPLSDMETYTGRRSAIFPHVKIAMESVATSEVDPTKFNYSTGTVTQRNYIQRKEGLKAEFHHCYGALLVEVSPDGDWWCRQINADSEGTIYDLDICVKKGTVITNNKVTAQRRGYEFVDESFVEGIKWGDIHEKQMDPKVREAAWGEGGVLDTLRPKYQFMDDIFDMFARNHHEMDDPYTMLQRYLTGDDSVEAEGESCCEFLENEAHRPWVTTVVVNSNHDRALERWLKDKRAQFDPPNLSFWHRMNARMTSYMHTHNGEKPIVLEETLLECWNRPKPPKGIIFLKQGATFIICPTRGGGVDNGQHGDDGPNGSRGTTRAFAKLGRKTNKGHDHRAAIVDSAYSTGCCLDLANPPSYQRGPSSASNSHIITYVNGKRAILTMWGENRQAWADRD